jgi:hypothetical protein
MTEVEAREYIAKVLGDMERLALGAITATARIDVLTRERDALREAQAWQPIETAPKDQTAVLAINTGNRTGDHGMKVCWRMAVGSDDYLNPRTGQPWRPTHWMLLPLAPAKEAD